jgi:hypothetical protein
MLRGQMAEFGLVVSKGAWHVKELVAELSDRYPLPEPLRQALLGLNQLLAALERQIAAWTIKCGLGKKRASAAVILPPYRGLARSWAAP